jgi:glycosyltransferase involved in cell wall biosynthesis
LLKRLEHEVDMGVADRDRLIRRLEQKDRIIDRLIGEIDELAAQDSGSDELTLELAVRAADDTDDPQAAVRIADARRRRAERDYAHLEGAFAALCCALNDGAKDFATVRHTLDALVRSYRFSDRVDELTRDTRFAIVQAHDNFGLWAAARLAHRDGAPLIVDLVEVTTLGERIGAAIHSLPIATRKYIESLDHKIIRRAASAYTVSASLREFLEARHKRDVLLLRNARPYCERPAAVDLREMCTLDADTKVVCYANRIGVDMGILELIDAVGMVEHDTALVCIGKFTDNETESAVRSYVADGGLGERVRFFDQLPPDRYVRFVAGADVGVNAVKPLNRNLKVSLPNRVFDYIAARVPMITSDVGDAGRIVRRYRIGEVFESVEPDQIARALERVFSKRADAYDDRLEAAARELSWEREAKHYARQTVRLAERAGDDGRRVAIVARKPILYNNRIFQQAKLLAENGFEVTIFSLSGFAPAMSEHLPAGVREVVVSAS